jgi:hypothetical protein
MGEYILNTKLKLYIGVGLFIFGWIMPLFGIWVATSALPVAVKGPIAGLLTLGGPEVCFIAAVALLGKETFNLLTSKVLAALHRMAPSGAVSRTRYRIGIALLLITCIPTYVMGYAPQYLPDVSPARLYVNIAADLLFVISLFVLGGDFWDKLRALFIYDAKAQFPSISE